MNPIILFDITYEGLMAQLSYMESLGFVCVNDASSGYDESTNQEFFIRSMYKP